MTSQTTVHLKVELLAIDERDMVVRDLRTELVVGLPFNEVDASCDLISGDLIGITIPATLAVAKGLL